MSRFLTILAAVAIGTLLAAAGDGAAQPKGPLPAVKPAPTPPPPPSFGSTPSPQQEIRITGPDGQRTRVLIEPGPATAGGPASSNAGAGFGSVPSFSRERRVIIEQDGTSREFLIQESGPPIDSPIIILPIR